MADFEPIRFDPQYYDINEEDVHEVTVMEHHLEDDLYARADELGLIPSYSPDSIREKYMNWCTKFKEHEPLAFPDPSAIVMVFGIPTVDEPKKEKLLKLIKLLCDKAYAKEAILKRDDINTTKLEFVIVPDEDKEGFYLPAAFIACKTPASAAHVADILDGIKIGKKNGMSTCLMSDVGDILQKDTPEYPGPPVTKLIDLTDTTGHLNDPMGREQFMVVTNDKKLEVMWNDQVLKQPQSFQEPITCANASWSSCGSFLYTMHNKGVKVRGNTNLHMLSAFPHHEVWEVCDSPDERYLITWNGMSNTDGSNMSVKINDVWTGHPVKTLWCPPISAEGNDLWPFFVWSSCSKYLACNDGSQIIILEEATGFQPMMAEDGKMYSIPLKNPRSSFAWSPSDPHLAVWTPPTNMDKEGRGDGPCSLKVIDVTKMRDIASKSLNIELDGKIQLMWHPQGTYFALRINVQQKVTKKTRKSVNQIEIFHMKLAGCPSDSILVPTDTAKLFDVAFEPLGDRLAVLLSDKLKLWSLKRDASKANTQLLCEKEIGQMTSYNRVMWSPQGTFFVLAGIDCGDGALSFNSITRDRNSSTGFKIDESHHDTHYAINGLYWDPSGRYCASVVSVSPGPNTDFSKAAESSYKIWTFQGKEITWQKNMSGSIMSFQWRPHPRPVLSQEKVKEVQKNVAKYGDKYNTDDDALRSAALSEVENAKNALLHKFQAQLDSAIHALSVDPMQAGWEAAWDQYEANCCEEGYEDAELGGHLGTETKVIRQVKKED